jgi:acetyl esterase/lipase
VDTKIEGVNVRIYTPKVVNTPNSPKYRPILVYYHGGGFAIGVHTL